MIRLNEMIKAGRGRMVVRLRPAGLVMRSDLSSRVRS